MIKPEFICHCQIPRPWHENGEDWGLCLGCRGIYDERLYEMRLRQHISGLNFSDLDEFLTKEDPYYASLPAAGDASRNR